MWHLYKFNLMQCVRRKEEFFWSLIFPLILATLFFVSFYHNPKEQMKPVPVAAVGSENPAFAVFLEELDQEVLEVRPMDETKAEKALQKGEVKGIFYNKKEPELTVAGVQISESILETLLDTFLQNQRMMEQIAREKPLGLPGATAAVSDYRSLTQQVSVGGRTMNNSVTYFFALIGMACLFGAFQGMTSAVCLRADQSALAQRRSITPVSRLTMVLSELLASFTIQFVCIGVLLAYLALLGISFGPQWPLLIPVCVLGSMTGISLGIFIGTLHVPEAAKIGILVGGSLLMSFLAGLMFGNMKDIVEHHAPLVNRLNPAALIADAFYSVSVYENMHRYGMNLALLAAITAALTLVSFWKLRRERYDSL